MKIKRFSQFIIEARGWGETPWFYKQAAAGLSDLSIEEGISDSIYDLEKRWESAQEIYWWNRSSRHFKANHFALNVKLRDFPDPDKVREILGRDEEDLSDEEIDEMFWQFVSDQREFEEESIINQYDWIDQTSWGGNSGGWFLISPTESLGDQIQVIEEDLTYYVDLKNELKNSPEEWDKIAKILNSPNYKRLKTLAMVKASEETADLEKRLAQVKRTVEIATKYINRVEKDLVEIQQIAKDFSNQIVTWFYEDYLPEAEVNEKKKPKGAPSWKDSNAPDANGKFKELGIKALADWLIKTRGGNMQKITGSLNQQIVFNRGKNPAYAKKMERVREEVKRKLNKRKDA